MKARVTGARVRLLPFLLLTSCAVAGAATDAAASRPYTDGRFQGRIAYSADGNHNDPDDWIASPVSLAILAEAGLKDRLVHFDYNCILPLTDPEWEKIHAESVLGAVERYGFDRSRFYDCRRDLNAAVAGIAAAVNASSADEPLFFIIAGPMEVPYLGIRQSDPAKRAFVYCISHSRWNDGFASKYKFTCTKRSVIEQGVHWVQIRDQNAALSFARYSRPATPEEFAPFFWMRDSRDAKVQWLWQRMLVSTRPDPSDAGMTWFLVTGDEACDPAKLKALLEDHRPVARRYARRQVRIEAENFRHLQGLTVEDRKDKNASHQLNVRLNPGAEHGRIRTTFDEPHTPAAARCDLHVRYLDEKQARCRYRVLINGRECGESWQSAGTGGGWQTRTLEAVEIRAGDEIQVVVEGTMGRLDYVELRFAAP